MDPSSPKSERSRPTTLWSGRPECLLHTTPVQLHGDELFWSQEDKRVGASRLIPDLNKIKASLSVRILKVAHSTRRNMHVQSVRTNNKVD